MGMLAGILLSGEEGERGLLLINSNKKKIL